MKNKKISKVFNNMSNQDIPVPITALNIPALVKDKQNIQKIAKQELVNTDKIKSNEVQVSSHTQADVNWAVIANKITVPNIVKSGLTIGTAQAASVLSAGVATGIGFALGGPAGATVGFYIGNVIGLGTGAVGGYKFGGFVAKQLEDKDRKDIVESGKTQIMADTQTKIERLEEIRK